MFSKIQRFNCLCAHTLHFPGWGGGGSRVARWLEYLLEAKCVWLSVVEVLWQLLGGFECCLLWEFDDHLSTKHLFHSVGCTVPTKVDFE